MLNEVVRDNEVLQVPQLHSEDQGHPRRARRPVNGRAAEGICAYQQALSFSSV